MKLITRGFVTGLATLVLLVNVPPAIARPTEADVEKLIDRHKPTLTLLFAQHPVGGVVMLPATNVGQPPLFFPGLASEAAIESIGGIEDLLTHGFGPTCAFVEPNGKRGFTWRTWNCAATARQIVTERRVKELEDAVNIRLQREADERSRQLGVQAQATDDLAARVAGLETQLFETRSAIATLVRVTAEHEALLETFDVAFKSWPPALKGLRRNMERIATNFKSLVDEQKKQMTALEQLHKQLNDELQKIKK